MNYKDFNKAMGASDYTRKNFLYDRFAMEVYWGVVHFLNDYREPELMLYTWETPFPSSELMHGLEYVRDSLGIPEMADTYNLYEDGRRKIRNIDKQRFISKLAYMK